MRLPFRRLTIADLDPALSVALADLLAHNWRVERVYSSCAVVVLIDKRRFRLVIDGGNIRASGYNTSNPQTVQRGVWLAGGWKFGPMKVIPRGSPVYRNF